MINQSRAEKSVFAFSITSWRILAYLSYLFKKPWDIFSLINQVDLGPVSK